MNSTVETDIQWRGGNISNCPSYHMYDIYVGIIGSFNVIDYTFCQLFMIWGIAYWTFKNHHQDFHISENEPQYNTLSCNW